MLVTVVPSHSFVTQKVSSGWVKDFIINTFLFLMLKNITVNIYFLDSDSFTDLVCHYVF